MLLDVPLDAEPELIVYGKLASGSWSWYAWWPRPPDSAFMLYFFFNMVCQRGSYKLIIALVTVVNFGHYYGY